MTRRPRPPRDRRACKDSMAFAILSYYITTINDYYHYYDNINHIILLCLITTLYIMALL